MNRYREMKIRHQNEVNAFPFMFAFNKEQFERSMREKFGLDPNKKEDLNKLSRIPGGGFIRKTDSQSMHDMFKRHKFELNQAIDKDEDGTGFIKDMFMEELANYEYAVSEDYEDTFNALGLTASEVFGSKKLHNGLKLAEKEYMENVW